MQQASSPAHRPLSCSGLGATRGGAGPQNRGLSREAGVLAAPASVGKMGGITAKFKLFSRRDACHERPQDLAGMRAYVTAAAWFFGAGRARRPWFDRDQGGADTSSSSLSTHRSGRPVWNPCKFGRLLLPRPLAWASRLQTGLSIQGASARHDRLFLQCAQRP
jgi:hypothetical protein